MNYEAMKFARGVLTGLLAALVAFGSPAFAAGGKLVIADAFPPTAGWAMETDDSFTLTKAGCLEGLARLDFDGDARAGAGHRLGAGHPDRVGRHHPRGREVPERRGA